MGKLSNKVAVITGGSSGIGLATAKLFVDEGADVAIFGRDQAALERAAQVLGPKALAVRGDVTSSADLQRLFEQTKRKFGAVDVVFANAGIAEFMPLEQVNAEHYNRVMDTNVRGVILTMQHALPVLSTPASVILTTSGVNKIGMVGSSVYSATKAAVRSLARTWSAELVGRGVRVNALSPGYTETPIFGKLGMDDTALAALAQQATQNVPLGRFAQASEMATAALFLASADSSFVVGAELDVDGGQTQL
jgi:NAD(P)-dependent dehydrogenase (short-subunit alcohol dehydrogenase family)